MKTTKAVGLPQSHHDCRHRGRGTREYNVLTMGQLEVSQAHLYILNNTEEVLPYIETHKQNLIVTHPKMIMMRVLQEYNRTFINLFRQTIFGDDSASKTLRLLVVWPNLNVPT